MDFFLVSAIFLVNILIGYLLIIENYKLIFIIFLICINFYFFSKIKKMRKVLAVLRGVCFSIAKRKKWKKIKIYDNCNFKNLKNIEIGDNVVIEHNTDIFPLGMGHPSNIKIGNNVYIGPYNRFSSADEIEIENDVLFAAYVHITDHSHEYRNIEMPIHSQGIYSKGKVKIGRNSWIGIKAEILSGVEIGEHCIIAAGAVVTKSIPSYSIAAGVPAKVVKRYDCNLKRWINV